MYRLNIPPYLTTRSREMPHLCPDSAGTKPLSQSAVFVPCRRQLVYRLSIPPCLTTRPRENAAPVPRFSRHEASHPIRCLRPVSTSTGVQAEHPSLYGNSVQRKCCTCAQLRPARNPLPIRSIRPMSTSNRLQAEHPSLYDNSVQRKSRTCTQLPPARNPHPICCIQPVSTSIEVQAEHPSLYDNSVQRNCRTCAQIQPAPPSPNPSSAQRYQYLLIPAPCFRTKYPKDGRT